MTVPQKTLWESFLSPVVGFLIDKQALESYALSIDWEKASSRIRRGDVVVPYYYTSQNFHGVEGGYLNSYTPGYYDAISQYFLPPHETLVRQALIDTISVEPRRILDLGCGTGSTTLMLKQAFPEAEVIGLDLSPYMLVRAEDKALAAGLDVSWRHGNAENTKFPDASFDLVTASLLFHETPTTVTQAIFQESFRLLVVGGQMLMLDANQKAVRQLEFFNHVFQTPYIQEYGNSNLDINIGAAGFRAVQTQEIWLIHQITSAVKPIPAGDAGSRKKVRVYAPTSIETSLDHGLNGLL